MTDLQGQGKADLIGFLVPSEMFVKPIVDYSNSSQTGKSFLNFAKTDVDRFSKVDYLPLV